VTARARVVIDTNLVLSALVFPGHTTALLRQAWRDTSMTPLVSRATVAELIRTLAYPKFRLDATQRRELLGDYLPFCQTVRIPSPPPSVPECRDPFDRPFLELAAAGRAAFIVTGDRDLLALDGQFVCPIVTLGAFLERD
jgi:putative PIN family toxin of toxin-antitoxin system